MSHHVRAELSSWERELPPLFASFIIILSLLSTNSKNERDMVFCVYIKPDSQYDDRFSFRFASSPTVICEWCDVVTYVRDKTIRNAGVGLSSIPPSPRQHLTNQIMRFALHMLTFSGICMVACQFTVPPWVKRDRAVSGARIRRCG